MRTRTKGILLGADGERVVNKQYKGQRIFQRLGTVSQDDAETWLREAQAEIDAERRDALRTGDDRLWRAAAARYLTERQQDDARTLHMISRHVTDLLPYIGDVPMRDICNEALEQFIADRKADGVKNSTINRSLEVVRTTVIRASRVWREKGKTWLASAPLIEMLDESPQKRLPYPITWAEQARLMPRLPAHLQATIGFSLNTGARDKNVCGLLWEWEREVPEIGRSVFVIPRAEFKGKRDHVLILNDVAWGIVQQQRGKHPTHVFTCKHPTKRNAEPVPFKGQNNSAFQKARAAVGLERVRVHDLRHTYGQRLREAGVQEEDRDMLMGHAREGMSQHYATATLSRLVKAANSVSGTIDRTTVLRVVNG
jgi:integrase